MATDRHDRLHAPELATPATVTAKKKYGASRPRFLAGSKRYNLRLVRVEVSVEIF